MDDPSTAVPPPLLSSSKSCPLPSPRPAALKKRGKRIRTAPDIPPAAASAKFPLRGIAAEMAPPPRTKHAARSSSPPIKSSPVRHGRCHNTLPQCRSMITPLPPRGFSRYGNACVFMCLSSSASLPLCFFSVRFRYGVMCPGRGWGFFLWGMDYSDAWEGLGLFGRFDVLG